MSLIMTEDVVEVPDVWDMDDDTFLKHLAARHGEEVDVPRHKNAINAWITTYRVFHDRLHEIAVPGQYDHEHEEDEEIEEDDE